MKKADLKEAWGAVWVRVPDHVQAQVWAGVRAQVWDRVWDRVLKQMWDQVLAQLRDIYGKE